MKFILFFIILPLTLILTLLAYEKITHHKACLEAGQAISDGKLWQAKGLLEQYLCPEQQRRYVELDTRDLSRLKSQQITIEVLLKNSGDRAETYADLFREGYNVNYIIESLNCRRDGVEQCKIYYERFPDLRFYLVEPILKFIPPTIENLDLCLKYYDTSLYKLITKRCLDGGIEFCNAFIERMRDDQIYQPLLETGVEHQNLEISKYAVEHGARCDVTDQNVDFLKQLGFQFKKPIKAYEQRKEIEAIVNQRVEEEKRSLRNAALTYAVATSLFSNSKKSDTAGDIIVIGALASLYSDRKK